MTSTTRSVASAKDAREFYETKEKAAKFYAENGVPQKMEEILNAMFYDNPSDVYGHLATYFEGFAKTPVMTKIKARPAVDIKAQSCIQTEVYCKVKNKETLVSTSVCSNAAPHLSELARQEDRDEEEKEREDSIRAALNFLNTNLCNKLQGLDPTKQSEIDDVVSKLMADLKQEEETRLAKEILEKEKEGGEAEEGKKSGSSSAVSKPPKSPKGKGAKGGAPVVIVPDEPQEKLLRGSLCVSAISQAVCCTGAQVDNIPLYQHIAMLKEGKVPKTFCLPQPMVTLLQSGRAAPGKSNCIKEYMIVPKPGVTIKQSLPQITAIYNNIIKSIIGKNGVPNNAKRGDKVVAKNVTDLGAIMFPLDRPEQGLDMVQEAITHAGLTPGEDYFIALNLAGHEIFDYEKGKYEVIVGQQKVAEDLAEYWSDLLGKYPSVIAIIDPMRKVEKQAWMSLCERVSDKCYVMGNSVLPRPGVLKGEGQGDDFKTSGAIFKMEQVNTVTDIIDCSKVLSENEIVLSSSLGETTDTFLADMAVGMQARFLKMGAPCRGERVAKLNRLLAIEDQLQEDGRLSQHGEFVFPHIAPPPPPDVDEDEAEDEPRKDSPKKK